MAAFKEPGKRNEKILKDESSKTYIPISEYAKKLTGNARQPYLDKIANIGIDPVLTSEKKYESECLPPVEAADFVIIPCT